MTAGARSRSAHIVVGLRTYAWLLLGCVLLGGAVPLLRPVPPSYEAEALIVVRQLVGRAIALPGLGERVFNSGTVARRVASDPAIGGDPRTLIPDRLDVVIEPDSIVFTVVGRSPDPTEAAWLANLGAVAFVDELNRGGSTLGSFALQSEAQVPSAPRFALGPLPQAALGAATGLAVGCVLAMLLGLVRRQVVTAADIEAIGANALGTVVLPARAAGRFPSPRAVPGVAALTRRLATTPSGRVMLVSQPSVGAERLRLLVMLAVSLIRLRMVSIQASPQVRKAVSSHPENAGRPMMQRDPLGRLVLVDGSQAIDALQPAALVILVIRIGMPRSQLRRMAALYAREDLLGAVIVDVRRTRSVSSLWKNASTRPRTERV